MNVVFLPRQKGKTALLIARAKEIGGQLVTNTVEDAKSVEKRAQEQGVEIMRPISIRQFNLRLGEITAKNIPVIIDDAEYCLQYLLNQAAVGAKVSIDTISICDDKG